MFAVLQTAFLGDTVLTTPLIAALARRGPVHVVTTPAAAPLLANNPAVASVIVFDKRGGDAGIAGVRRVASRLRATGATTAILAQGSLRTAALSRLAGIPRRIGFASSPGRVLYTARIEYRRDLHHAGRLLMLDPDFTAGTALPSGAALRPSLYPGAGDAAAVRALLHGAGIPDDAPLVALAPGSVWATKRWPSYDALAQRLATLARTRDARIVVLGGSGDAPLAAAISAALTTMDRPAALDATGKLSLLASAALIGRARVLVTNDSAPLHLASAMNTPTVALFGPTVPAFGFGPLADSAAVLGHDALSCRPCDAHGPKQCPLGHWRCMRELSEIAVGDAVERIAALP
ncbi:MAG TPA: lipopolysaccharide heptosyltransferase II [Gemmatimonas sp.]|nr:lipopolysaccharide heptosyltransferase II [Gemmatimonas sp.]